MITGQRQFYWVVACAYIKTADFYDDCPFERLKPGIFCPFIHVAYERLSEPSPMSVIHAQVRTGETIVFITLFGLVTNTHRVLYMVPKTTIRRNQYAMYWEMYSKRIRSTRPANVISSQTSSSDKPFISRIWLVLCSDYLCVQYNSLDIYVYTSMLYDTYTFFLLCKRSA